MKASKVDFQSAEVTVFSGLLCTEAALGSGAALASRSWSLFGLAGCKPQAAVAVQCGVVLLDEEDRCVGVVGRGLCRGGVVTTQACHHAVVH